MNAVAVGKFDALHVGHRALAMRASAIGAPRLLRLTGLAEAFGWPVRAPIVAEDDRLRVLDGWHAGLREAVADIRGLRELDGAGFLDWLQRTCSASALVVGADFRCGRGRTCGVDELAGLCQERSMRLEVVGAVAVDGRPASSSRVREALAAGDCAEAERCLGRPHRLHGTVQRGDGRGRGLGFPTANLGSGANQAPATGVYAARATVLGRGVAAAVNVGVLPTIGGDRPQSIEAHLLGWSGDCYGAPLDLDLVARVRPEQRFASLADLREQIGRDVAAVAGLIA
jgi:riboflavin kinase / FMN adenylyltransferase